MSSHVSPVSSASSSSRYHPRALIESSLIPSIQEQLDQLILDPQQLTEQIRNNDQNLDLLYLEREAERIIQHLSLSTTGVASLSSSLSQLVQSYTDKLRNHQTHIHTLTEDIHAALQQIQDREHIHNTPQKQIHSLYKKYAQLQNQATNTRLVIAACQQSLDIRKQLKQLNHLIQQSKFSIAIQSSKDCQIQLHTMGHIQDGIKNSKIYQTLQAQWSSLILSLYSALTTTLQSSVTSSHTSIDDRQQTFVLSINPSMFLSTWTDLQHLAELAETSDRALDRLDVIHRQHIDVTLIAYLHSVLYDRMLLPILTLSAALNPSYRWTMVFAQRQDNSANTETRIRQELTISSVQSFTSQTSTIDICEVIVAVVQFACDHIFSMRDDHSPSSLPLFHSVASLLWPSLYTLLADNLLHPSIPRNVTELVDYPQRIGNKIRNMENHLNRLHIIQPTQDSSNHTHTAPLSTFVSSVTSHFLSSVRLSVLDRCRVLLLSNDYQVYDPKQISSATIIQNLSHQYPSLFFATSASAHDPNPTSSAADSDTDTETDTASTQFVESHVTRVSRSFFLSHPCSISAHMYIFIQTLWETCSQALACLQFSSDACAHLLMTIKEAVWLLLAIPNVYSSEQLEAVRLITCLFANDCLFVAHHINQMQQYLSFEAMCQHPTQEDTSISALIDFNNTDSVSIVWSRLRVCCEQVKLLDCVPQLSALSDRWFTRSLVSLHKDTQNALDSLPQMKDLHKGKNADAVMQHIRQCLYQIQQQYRVLAEVLQASQLSLIFGLLLQSLVECVIQRILLVTDISEYDAERMEACLALLNTGENAALVHPVFTRSWPRLIALQLLISAEQSLVQIEKDWQQHKFDALQKDELTHLISALYVASAARDKLIGRIRDSS